MALTRQEIVSVLGPSDDTLIAQIAATDATLEELAEARAWVDAEESLVEETREFPLGKVAQIIEVLSPEDDEP